MNFYLFLSSALLIIVLGAWLLVKHTPFTTWIGAENRLQSKEAQAIQTRLTKLQERISAQSTYITILKDKLEGKEVEVPEMTVDSTDDKVEEGLNVARIPLDDSLRQRVQRSNINLPVRTPFILNVTEEGNLEDEFLIPPIRGTVRKSFAAADGHFGVDIIAPANSAVKAILGGLVIESDWTLEGGNTIIIQHQYNLVSVYKHNSALLKKKGEQVKTGEAIAIIGDTGLHSDGPHVHFELWYNEEAIDPEAYIALENQ